MTTPTVHLVVDYGDDTQAREAVEKATTELREVRSAEVEANSTAATEHAEKLRKAEHTLATALWHSEHFEDRRWWTEAEAVAKGGA